MAWPHFSDFVCSLWFDSSPTCIMSSEEVLLAVYDLSRGMARSLSAQLLGPDFAVDAIPHTGLVVYGQEYFFGAGAGIQCENPMAFRQTRGMSPMQVIKLGRTRVSQSEFETWCRARTADGSFAGSSYDLLSHNCNTFSNQAARQGLGLEQGVPEWILQVPQRFLSSPMGMMMRPMLENMQLAGPTNGETTSVFASPPAASSTSSVTNRSSSNNPWASIPSSSTTGSDSSSAESSPPSPKKLRSSGAGATQHKPVSTPVLDSFTQPLISSDTNMIPMCLKKLKGVASDEEFGNLEEAARLLTHTQTSSPNASRRPIVPAELATAVCQTLHRALEGNKQVSFVLLFLRVLLLHLPQTKLTEGESIASCEGCLTWIQQHLVKDEVDGGTMKAKSTSLSPVARAASWLTLSNAVALGWLKRSVWGTVVEAALADWNPSVQTHVQVRQAASSFLYNVTLDLSSTQHRVKRSDVSDSDADDDDLVTSILCFGLEGLLDERDETCRLRRCTVLGRLLLKSPPCAANNKPSRASDSLDNHSKEDSWQDRRTLAVELGIATVLTSLITTAATNSSHDAATFTRLAEELLTALV